MCRMFLFFLFKQKTAYDMRISDWSSDVCSSDLESLMRNRMILACTTSALGLIAMPSVALAQNQDGPVTVESAPDDPTADDAIVVTAIQRSLQTSQAIKQDSDQIVDRSEEHTSELQSLMRTSYDVFILKTN